MSMLWKGGQFAKPEEAMGHTSLEELLMRAAQRMTEVATASLAHLDRSVSMGEALTTMADLRRAWRQVERVQRAVHAAPTSWVEAWLDAHDELTAMPLVPPPYAPGTLIVPRQRVFGDPARAEHLIKRLDQLQQALEKNDASLLPEDMR